MRTTYPDGTKVYTLFPDYELEDPPGTGANTIRITHRLAGQIAAVQKLSGTADELFYALTDHLGSIVGLVEKGGTELEDGSAAAYEPFGAFITTPTTNPGTSDNGFTGHRHNNTGANNLGLIYMNARYYHPQLGRFVSPDSIVPEPENPQSHNRYSYVRNSPLNSTDPTGHMETDGCTRGETCQSLSNPWKLTESMLDRDRNGVVPDREIDREMDRLAGNSEATLLAGSSPPTASSLNPFGGRMTSANCGVAGRPPCDARHPAVDSRTNAHNRFDPIYATAPGKVVGIGYAGDGFGNYVIIEHNVYETFYYSIYSHNGRVYVAVGDVVIAGTVIANMGDTHAQAIVHLHFEIRTPANLSLDQSNPFTGYVYWPTSVSSLASNYVDLGGVYGYADTYRTWAEANP